MKFIKKGLIISFLLTAIFPIHAAQVKKKTSDPNEVLQKGRMAFLSYDFETAADLYDEYRTLQEKAKKPLNEDLEVWEQELEIASGAFDRIQKIVVIDSLSVPAVSFYNSYRLASSAGNIGSMSSFTDENPIATNEIGFVNEDMDYFIFPQTNDEGNLRLMEMHKLLDGTWEINETLEGEFDKTGDYSYPFMSGDGQTLYFANNGEESMGGMDIFVAQKDALSGEYRQPLNLGMPFNSPYDDMMMAIDEENGIGWWATDRNRKDGNVTIYVYLIEDMRRNYPSDTDNLIDLAKLSNYKMTWEEDKQQEYKQKQLLYRDK